MSEPLFPMPYAINGTFASKQALLDKLKAEPEPNRAATPQAIIDFVEAVISPPADGQIIHANFNGRSTDDGKLIMLTISVGYGAHHE